MCSSSTLPYVKGRCQIPSMNEAKPSFLVSKPPVTSLAAAVIPESHGPPPLNLSHQKIASIRALKHGLNLPQSFHPCGYPQKHLTNFCDHLILPLELCSFPMSLHVESSLSIIRGLIGISESEGWTCSFLKNLMQA